MIYLLRVQYKEFTLSKIGYAKNIKKRLSSYITENPLIELMAYREGSRKEEKIFHRVFSSDKYKKGHEWFYWKEYTLEKFLSLDYNQEHKKFLIEKISKERDLQRQVDYYEEIKEKYDKDYLDDQLEKTKEFLNSIDYKLSTQSDFKELDGVNESILQDFLDNYFYATNFFDDRLKLYCEFRDKYQDNPIIIEGLLHRIDNPKFHQFYTYFGTSGCRAKSYEEKKLDTIWRDATRSDKLSAEIYSEFKEGNRIILPVLKDKIREIYKRLSISRSPKATDIKEFFEISKTNIITPDGKKKGFKLKKKLK